MATMNTASTTFTTTGTWGAGCTVATPKPICCSQCGRNLGGQTSVTYINGQPWCVWCQQACFGQRSRCSEMLIWIFENAPLIRERMEADRDPGRTSNAPPDMRLPYQHIRNVS